jgi:hypothetical protein
LIILNRSVVGDRLAAGLLDLLDNQVSGFGGLAFASRGAAEIVDDDLRPA